ncbi:Metallo-dependent phosphatase [Exidia glandulosa HHB12029]|uniref:Metallo-dependent phosphatase n=1 Tax=Exidia glandulosa HHB12029 TaxID=1314781 RepID=A0A165DN49_EXIGL|nr:Metallo-dependent phosphatase [Exidia glandulosa HHB12029]
MMFSFQTLLVLTYLSGTSFALPAVQIPLLNDALDPYASPRPRVTFSTDGSFKLLVFSDLHFGERDRGDEKDAQSVQLMTRILAEEQPDYVVINGDLLTGDDTFASNVTAVLDQIFAPLNAARVPFSSTHGNHDNHLNITHAQEIEYEQAAAPLSYTRASPGVGGQGGEGCYWVPVYKNADDEAPALVLWFFDSRGGISSSGEALADWVDESVAEWIARETEQMNDAWGPSEQRAALAFTHIPPHFALDLQANLNSTLEPGLNEDHMGPHGSTQSTPGNDAFISSLAHNVKNLHALVSGHDHGLEWCKRETTTGVVLCFNKHSGYGGYGQDWWGFGARIFQFAPDEVTRGVETWIRLEDGSVRAKVHLNSQYE